MQCHVIVLDVNNNIVVGACPVATDWNFADEKMWGQQQQCYVTVAKYEVGKGKGTQGLSTLAWNAASLLLGYPCCIIPHIVRDYGSRDERSLWEKPRRVIRGGLGSHCVFYIRSRGGQIQHSWNSILVLDVSHLWAILRDIPQFCALSCP